LNEASKYLRLIANPADRSGTQNAQLHQQQSFKHRAKGKSLLKAAKDNVDIIPGQPVRMLAKLKPEISG
jgi:hypothetical protein